MDDLILQDLRTYGGEPALALLAEVRTHVDSDWFYVFRILGDGAAASGSARERTVLAFATPDAALTFAQRNNLTIGPASARLRRLSLAQLLLALLRTPAIRAIVLVADVDQWPPAGTLPTGLRLERQDILQRLQP